MANPESQIPSYENDVKGIETFLRENVPEKSMNVFVHDAESLGKEFPSALKLFVGDKAPNFELVNASNKKIGLYDFLKRSTVIVTFYRGAWCPYCNLQLQHFQSVLPEIKEANAELFAISPQIPDASMSMKEKEELEFEVLSDVGNEVTRQFVTVFKNSDEDIDEMKEMGIEFSEYYADDSNEIPIPGTFIIEQDGVISFAQSEGGDYRGRTETSVILKALK